MNEKKRKDLLEAARAIKDFCNEHDCDECPFDRNPCNWAGDWPGPPCEWEMPDEQ